MCNSRLNEYLNMDNSRSVVISKAKTLSLLNCISSVVVTIAVNRLNILSTSVYGNLKQFITLNLK